jgi:hypothetical protein
MLTYLDVVTAMVSAILRMSAAGRLVFGWEARHHQRMARMAGIRDAGTARLLGFWVIAAAIGVGQSGCGSSVSTPTLPPPAAGPFADISGKWTGTIESSNLPTRTITLTASQTGTCVDGGWVGSNWSGAISGFADATSYSGQMSFERMDDGGQCTAIATVSGPVGSKSLRWTGTGFMAIGSCAGELPQAVIVTLQRQ